MADRAPPTISVLTPVYNGEKYLAECIESVLAQTRGDWEHVIVDNRSQDRSGEIAEHYAAQDARIKVIRCDEFVNVHRNFSRSARLMHPQSRFCKFISADDWIYPECLERMVALAERHPEVCVVSSYKLEGLDVGNGGIVPYGQEVLPGREVVRMTLLTGRYLTGSPTQLLYRAEPVRRSHEFFDETVWHSDTHAAFRTLLTCDLGFVHQVLTFTRLHPGALTSLAQHLNTHLAYEVRLLVQFGRDVLSEPEYRSAIRSALHRYWWYLAKQNLKPWRLREVQFHSYHRTEISRMLAELKHDRQSEIFLKHLRRWLRDVPAAAVPAGKRATGAAQRRKQAEALGGDQVKDLKESALRGGLAKALAQVASFVMKIGSTAILARLLAPRDFGLVAMVTAITGMLAILKDAGLSLPTVQKQSITDGQLSTLFWLNVLVGLVLTAACAALAPVVAGFYHDTRLVQVTLATAPSFLLSALGVQHNAILMRRMQFPTLALIDVLSLLVSSLTGVTMAWLGFGYWSLIGMSLSQPAATTLGAWLAARWKPGGVHFDKELGSMFRLGGALTLDSLIVYIGYNVDKLLLGRYWGAGALGIYGRGYVLVNIPADSLNTSVGSVALSALSRLQGDPPRLRAFFLKAYSLIVSLTVPTTIACAVFAEEIVAVILGPRWGETAVIVRLLTPTILVFGLINPAFWLIFSHGLMRRSVYLSVAVAAVAITAYTLGLPYGPRGVAAAYSLALVAWALPHLAWCVHGTSIRVRDLARAAAMPMVAGLVAAIACLALKASGTMPSLPLARLLEGGFLLAAVYVLVLLYVMRQLSFYMDLVRSLFSRQAPTGSPTT